jgi:cytochrome o ubiquinol oxidase subunit 3
MTTAHPALASDLSAANAKGDPYRIGHGARATGHGHGVTGHGEGGAASKLVTVAYGFWIFLLSDIVMFSAFFAAYAVLAGETAGGPSGSDLFELRRVAIETGLLLTSSFTCGLASIATFRRDMLWTHVWLLTTGFLGAAFLLLEIQEFAEMIEAGAGPSRSAFLSAFYALVGCHGLHVGMGILWLGTMMAQLFAKGFRDDILRRLLCFNLFWHALDIVWIAVFTIVYLLGANR